MWLLFLSHVLQGFMQPPQKIYLSMQWMKNPCNGWRIPASLLLLLLENKHMLASQCPKWGSQLLWIMLERYDRLSSRTAIAGVIKVSEQLSPCTHKPWLKLGKAICMLPNPSDLCQLGDLNHLWWRGGSNECNREYRIKGQKYSLSGFPSCFIPFKRNQ